MKVKTIFICNNCAYKSSKWLGKCPSCNSWNSFLEEIETKKSKSEFCIAESNTKAVMENLSNITIEAQPRIITKDDELNRVLGGGIVPGAVYLISGEPGVGKSTLLLQLVLANDRLRSLYITAEESKEQIKLRADRVLRDHNHNICYILADNNLQNILHQAEQLLPNLIIIDSIQTVYSSNVESLPGSMLQVRECTFNIINFAKKHKIPIFIVGHITKEGGIAGPKLLEHMVDAVLQFEGDNTYTYRILRAIKNRFGPSSALGIYEMTSLGLKEVKNPSYVLISNTTNKSVSGTSIACIMQGLQPLLIESQALVANTVYNIAQRSATGFNNKRLDMLLAVIEKKCGLRLVNKDVFLNITGGLKIEDTSADLGIISSIMSSYSDIAIQEKTCFIGEVGLTGEIRPVSRIGDRVKEAQKLGFTNIFIPKTNKLSKEITLNEVNTIGEVSEMLFN